MKNKGSQADKKSLADRAKADVDVRSEMKKLERMIEDLKVDYEQFFLGLTPYMPDKLHNEVKKQIRFLRRAPFKNSQSKYQLRTLESRYNTYNNYWQRTIREKEEGTYSKDVFKAEMRARHAHEDALAGTEQGAASKGMQDLYNSYKSALEKTTGKSQSVDFGAFQKSLIKRAKAFKEEHGSKKMAFKVKVKNGKVVVQAKVKEA